jgi:hypothetical protein
VQKVVFVGLTSFAQKQFGAKLEMNRVVLVSLAAFEPAQKKSMGLSKIKTSKLT